jgi:hypothetical protein
MNGKWRLGHKCAHCGGPATWQSNVDFAWRCADPGCQPCWCLSCWGQVGAHDAAATAAYQARARAAIAGYRLVAVPDDRFED